MLGEPENWDVQEDRYKAEIWRYGSIELYFPRHGDGLTMIFSDHLEPFEGSTTLTLDPWILGTDLSLSEAETILKSEGIIYERRELPELDASELTMASGVMLRFDTVDGYADRMFTAFSFWLKTTQPEHQRPATKQVSVTLPLHVYEKLRQESLTRRRSIASLCSDLLINHLDDLGR